MLDDIMLIFDRNIGRISNLINLYKTLTQGRGRKPAHSLDILRATVVLLHSTLEDYLRNLQRWKLPTADKERLNKIPLVGTSESGRATKFELGELVRLKEKSIKEIIELSINEYLDTQSYNDTSDVCKAIKDAGVKEVDTIEPYLSQMNLMIKRRHNIVHQADRGGGAGKGHHRIKSLSLNQVESWKRHLDKFVLEVNKQLRIHQI
jgi:hypothetical protein